MINNMLNECKTVPANRAIINKKWILIDAINKCCCQYSDGEK